jgi:hypothetical protein
MKLLIIGSQLLRVKILYKLEKASFDAYMNDKNKIKNVDSNCRFKNDIIEHL